jgi:hypothetical protein
MRKSISPNETANTEAITSRNQFSIAIFSGEREQSVRDAKR